MSKILLFFLKLFVIAAIFTFLIARAVKGSVLTSLTRNDIRIPLLLVGFFFNFLATATTLIRWRLLTLALGGDLSLSDAMRFGFIGFMFNLSPVGIIGGDAIKVYLLAKKNNTSVDDATAGVVVDRVIGLYTMFLMGLLFVIVTGFSVDASTFVRVIYTGLLALTALSTIFLAFFLIPSSSKNRRIHVINAIPFVGKFLAALTESIMKYQRKRRVLFYSFLLTVVVHCSFSVSLFYTARGIFAQAPSLIDHAVLYCVGNIGSIVPLSAGPLEYLLDELYPFFTTTNNSAIETGYGMTVGLTFRLLAVFVALVGVAFYLTSKKEVTEALAQAQEKDSMKNAME
ncbi:MAG: lysylphosphatidylglycerol synthase transmembrane domain-containing protein [Thermoguttaceae bacterium]